MVAIRVLKSIFVLCTVLVDLDRARAARKYNVDEECQKLYNEDLSTVLRRFHTTPDYLKILNSRISEYHMYISDMKNQITYHFLQQQHLKVKQMLGIKKDGEHKPANIRVGNAFTIRNARRASAGDNKTKVERLDSYKKLSSALTVAQRNAMRDLGFTYAGNVIHALVKNMGGDDGRSTQAAIMDNGDLETTTRHVSVHTVSTPINEDGGAFEKGPGDEAPAGGADEDATRLRHKDRT